MLTQEPGATGRGKNTAWWAGLANLFCKSDFDGLRVILTDKIDFHRVV